MFTISPRLPLVQRQGLALHPLKKNADYAEFAASLSSYTLFLRAAISNGVETGIHTYGIKRLVLIGVTKADLGMSTIGAVPKSRVLEHRDGTSAVDEEQLWRACSSRQRNECFGFASTGRKYSVEATPALQLPTLEDISAM